MTTYKDETFERQTTPYKSELLRYCGKLAGSAWDGEDLFQEVMLKAYRRFIRWPERELSKPYLYRIAANAWFDSCRRRKIAFLPELLADYNDLAYSEWNRHDVRESLEYLMDALEPRQVVLILLTDVFGFSPTETGRALGQPVTAIKAVLHRARTRLKKAAERQLHWLETATGSPNETAMRRQSGTELFESFVRAFREADMTAMFRSYRELSGAGITIDRVMVVRGQAWFYFKDPDGHVLMVSTPFRTNQLKQEEQ
ncbi:sigma-70 family RNA polymerase sigma factor [Paenibacillus sp. CF384]|uniref:sigma-70 family RNA polymerase sigma factor n=1 Tax=Paenibacillus sp. CF384 TaxID=1884382 RepID=UPI000896ABA6|nr:sigma-70 family RNA polymerase sigma factor [Paenibacillus sp. CF384]SDX58197.1 RNA polymerase sigma-70 factor, ECF subfamily [Paenibacillus sp. CF384]